MFKLVQTTYKSLPFQVHSLLIRIDDKLIVLAKRKRDSIILGERMKVSNDYQLLLLLREVLMKKSCGDKCLCEFKFDDIAEAINKILYNIC